MSTTMEDFAELLKKAAGFDSRLWDTADVALFLKLNPDHVRKFICTRADFPAPVDLPGKGSEPIRRFRPVDVRDWSERFRA